MMFYGLTSQKLRKNLEHLVSDMFPRRSWDSRRDELFDVLSRQPDA
jgi:hypothetical protein